MKRAASIVLLAVAGLLSGCATDLYSYRGGSGDYYHGEARPDVRIYGGGYYGYPRYYGPWRYGAPYRYGHYGYGGPYRYGYGYPYARPWPYYGPYHPRVRPRYHDDRGQYQRRDRDGSPWRNLDEFRRAGSTGPRPQGVPVPARPQSGDAGPRAEGSRFRRAAEAAVRRSGRDAARSVEP